MKNKNLIALGLVAFGVIGRIWARAFLPAAPHFYINLAGMHYPVFMIDMFFFIASISLIAGRYFGKYSFLIPISIMAISDIYFGNNWIFLFTWSGFAMMTLMSYSKKKKSFSTYFGYGIISVILYDIWTNFGSWLGWYSHDLNGLLICYTVAIPFMLWHLLSTIIALPFLSMPFEYSKLHLAKETKKMAIRQ